MKQKNEKILVCCRNCKFLKLEYIHDLNQNYISYHQLENHPMIEPPSGTCQTKIQLCQHAKCFDVNVFAIMGLPAFSYIRIQGQAQLNPYGECPHYKRLWYKFWKPKKYQPERTTNE